MKYLVLLSGISLSVLAAFLSVLGMLAIFPGSPLIIGSVIASIEFSKYVTAKWLHTSWSWLTLRYKIAASTILLVLMLLTSMSIFGYFSKQHLENNTNTGEISAQIEIINSKIELETQTIITSKKSIEQLNTVVDQVVARSDKESSIIRANKLRNSQKAERKELLESINTSNTAIQKLNTEKFPLESENRKLEVEVGPLKYIASLIYDDVNSDVLEKSVRWVIILIVLVFDPLAILMLLAFSMRPPEIKTLVQEPKILKENPLSKLEKSNRVKENIPEKIKPDVVIEYPESEKSPQIISTEVDETQDDISISTTHDGLVRLKSGQFENLK